MTSFLPQTDVQTLVLFIKESLKESLWPVHMEFELTNPGKSEQGSGYTATWVRDGKVVSLLYGLTRDNKKVQYLRVWVSPPGDGLDAQKAVILAKEYFLEPFVTVVNDLPCQPMEHPEFGKITECAKMVSKSSGDLWGITLKSPVMMGKQNVTIISACWVPPEGARFYTLPSCI